MTRTRPRTRTTPGLYLRKRTWWTKTYVNGQPVRESTGCRKFEDARRVLDQRRGRIATGEPLLPRLDRITYDDAAKDLRQHYATTGSRNLVEAEKRLKHLDRFFTGRRLAAINGAVATAYVVQRQAATADKRGAANGTVNRELSVLIKMLRLAAEHGKAARVPRIRQLKEADPRQGFVEPDRFAGIIRQLPEPHALGIRLCYALAWRRGEVFDLGWRHVDLSRGVLRLEPGRRRPGRAGRRSCRRTWSRRSARTARRSNGSRSSRGA